jgi:hypothetical protein
MDAGQVIHDVVPDPAREVRSVFYEMERTQIGDRAYENYVQVGG